MAAVQTTTPPDIKQRSDPGTNASETQLTGPARLIGRALWGSIFAYNIILLVVGLMSHLGMALARSTTVAVFRIGPTPLDISYDALLLYRTVLDVLVVLGFWIVAGLIFWKKSDDWWGIFVSLTLITLGLTATSIPSAIWIAAPRAYATVSFNAVIAVGLFLLFLYLFPNGRFVPSWTTYLAAAWIILLGVSHFLPEARALRLTKRSTEIQLIVLTIAYLTGIAAQIYRRAKTRDAVQIQQTKWVTFGFICAVIGIAFAALSPLLVTPLLNQRSIGNVIFWFIATAVFTVGMLMLPAAIGVSILRYRLWDIQEVITRTLVYTLVTGILTLVYLSVSGIFQQLSKGVGGSTDDVVINEIKVLIATGITFLLFKPVKNRLQEWLDRRFHREKVNVQKVFGEFSQQVYDLIDLSALLSALTKTVDNSLHIHYAAVFLQDEGGLFQLAHDYKTPTPTPMPVINDEILAQLQAGKAAQRPKTESYTLLVPLILPRIAQNKLEGLVAFGARLSGQTYSADDEHLLIGLANQVSMAMYAGRLMREMPTKITPRSQFAAAPGTTRNP